MNPIKSSRPRFQSPRTPVTCWERHYSPTIETLYITYYVTFSEPSEHQCIGPFLSFCNVEEIRIRNFPNATCVCLTVIGHFDRVRR